MGFRFSEYKWPAMAGRVPFKHQITTTEMALSYPRLLILNEMGTGKTMSICWAIDILLLAGKVDRVYVVAPLSVLKAVWAKEFFFNLPHIKYAICHGSPEKRRQVIRSSAQVIIINPDGIKSMHNEIVKFGKRQLLVIDELTTYKNASSDRTEQMIDFAEPFKGVWGATGELTPDSPVEAWSQVKVVNPFSPLLPTYVEQFRNATMYRADLLVDVPKRPGEPAIWRPKQDADKLVAAIARPAVRFKLRDCIDLPPTIYTDVEPPMSAEQEDAYQSMKQKLYLETETGEITAANAAVKLMKLVQIASGAIFTNEREVHTLGCKPMLDHLVDTWKQTYNRKMIIVCAFKPTFAMLQRFAADRYIRCATINGDVPQNVRSASVDRFQNGDLNWLLLQPQAAAHGLTLTAASYTYWFTLTPSNELYNQTNARTVRPSQTETTYIMRKISSSAERHYANILDGKADMSGSIMRLFREKML
jgi:hypothetical protein